MIGDIIFKKYTTTLLRIKIEKIIEKNLKIYLQIVLNLV